MEELQKVTVEVKEDEKNIRHDIESCDIINTYPDLPKTKEWNLHKEFVKMRSNYIKQQDQKAYENLKAEHDIDFVPPTFTS